MKLKTPKFPGKGHHDVVQAPPPSYVPQPSAQAHLPRATEPAPVSPLKKAMTGLAAPTRQRNAAVMIAGAVFVIIAAALAASVASSFDDSIEVLVAANKISEGQIVDEADFRAVNIAAGEGDIQAVAPDSLPDLVGRVAAGPIGEGSMIHPAQFAIASEETKVVIGAALGPNSYPASGLKPGDQVRLLEVADAYGGSGDADSFVSSREIAIGEVTHMVELNGQAQRHFSIRVGESAASVAAQRAYEGRLTLALVDNSRTLEQVEALTPADPVVPLELQTEDEADE